MTGFGRKLAKGDRFPQEGASTKACPQVSWRLGRLRCASACFPRDRTKQTRRSRPRMAAGPGMGTHHSRGIRRGAEPYAVRGTSGVAAGTAQSRRLFAPDGCSAPRLVAAGHHRSPGLCCHAQRRSPSPAAWAAGMPPHPGVPNKPGQRAAGHHGGRDDPRCRPRSRCARCGHTRRLGAAAAALHPDRPRNHRPAAAARCTTTATGHPAARCAERVRLGVDHASPASGSRDSGDAATGDLRRGGPIHSSRRPTDRRESANP